jgi:hypothetical protein
MPRIRTCIGTAACAVYFWRVQDPKGSYAVFYDVTDWLTALISSLFVADGAVVGFLRNAINLVLLDQVEGFLIGIAFATLFSALLWPFKAGGRAAVRKARSLRRRNRAAPGAAATPEGAQHPSQPPEEPLLLTMQVSPPLTDSSRPGN